MRLSTTTLARGSARRPWLTLALWAAALVAIVAVIVLVLPGTLTAQYSFLGNPDSQRGRDLLQQRMNMPQKANEVVIVRSTATAATAPAFRSEVLGLQKQIAALGPGVVDSTVSAFQGGDKTLISADGHTAIIPVVMAGDLTQAEKNIDKVHEVVHNADGKGGFDTLVTGAASINSDFSHTAETDLQQGRGHRRADRARDPADRVRRRGRRRAADPAQPDRHHHGDRPDGTRRPDVRRLGVRHQHGEHDGPGDGHRLLAVHHLAVPRGAGARA